MNRPMFVSSLSHGCPGMVKTDLPCFPGKVAFTHSHYQALLGTSSETTPMDSIIHATSP